LLAHALQAIATQRRHVDLMLVVLEARAGCLAGDVGRIEGRHGGLSVAAWENSRIILPPKAACCTVGRSDLVAMDLVEVALVYDIGEVTALAAATLGLE
jgi:hypothetical protein